MELEYIGIDSSKQVYGKKNLLYCQMELLTILKKIKAYKKLRKEEFALKKILKRKVDELKNILKNLNKILPETKKDKFRAARINHSPKKRKDLESEIENIKRKIAELH
jgi:hypothetical protein